MGSEEQINSVLEVKKALRQKSDDSFLPFVDEESWIISYFWLFDADKQSFKMKIVDEENICFWVFQYLSSGEVKQKKKSAKNIIQNAFGTEIYSVETTVQLHASSYHLEAGL